MRVPKKPGGILLQTCKKTQNANPTTGLTQNIHTTRSTSWRPPRPTEAAQQNAPSSEVRLARGLTPLSSEVRLARGFPPPSSRVRFARGSPPPSNRVRLVRGLTPPSSEVYLARGSLTSAPAPARVYGHLMLWHVRAAPLRAWESRPGAVPPTP
jgi:hypothetical protein